MVNYTITKQDFNNTFFQSPKWLFDLFLSGELKEGAYKTYVLMYDRVRISRENNWIDNQGFVYIKYSYAALKKDLQVNSDTSISKYLKQLEELDLIDKKRQFSSSSIFYIKIHNHQTSQECSSVLHDCEEQFSTTMKTNNNNYNNNNYNNNSLLISEKKCNEKRSKKQIDFTDCFEKFWSSDELKEKKQGFHSRSGSLGNKQTALEAYNSQIKKRKIKSIDQALKFNALLLTFFSKENKRSSSSYEAMQEDYGYPKRLISTILNKPKEYYDAEEYKPTLIHSESASTASKKKYIDICIDKGREASANGLETFLATGEIYA